MSEAPDQRADRLATAVARQVGASSSRGRVVDSELFGPRLQLALEWTSRRGPGAASIIHKWTCPPTAPDEDIIDKAAQRFREWRKQDALPAIVPDHKQWIDATWAKPAWHLAEVLFWITYRDASAMAEHLAEALAPDAPMRWYHMGAGSICEAFDPGGDGKGVQLDWGGVEPNPVEALMRELTSATILATGFFEDALDRTAIGGSLWSDLRLADVAEHPGRAVAVRRRRPRRDAYMDSAGNQRRLRGHWVDVMFDRESVLAALPPAIPEPVAEVAPVAAWAPKSPNEAKRWAVALTTTAGARAEMLAKGKQADERAIRSAIHEMWNVTYPDRPLTRETIASYRRRKA